jgi:hypothetical protein
VDRNNKGVTLLDTLTNNYKFGLILTLLSLMYFIGVQFFIPLQQSTLSLGDGIFYPLIGFLVLDFVYCFAMLSDLIKIIIQEGKSRAV